MYHIIVAEDEIMVREGICKRIDFEKLGFSLAGSCANGKEVVELIKSHPVDVVLTDICMPVMDGLALARYIRDNRPNIKIILLTGYSDFEYAREAIKAQVYEYMLKPVTSKLLTQMLEKVKRELDGEREKRRQQKKLEQELYVSGEIVKEHYLNQLVARNIPEATVKQEFEELGIPYPADTEQFRAMIVSLDHGEEAAVRLNMTKESLMYGVCNICRDICEARGLVFRSEAQKVVILFFDSPGQFPQRVRLVVKQVYQTSASVYIGDPVSQLGDICRSYEQAAKLARYAQLLGEEQIVYGKDFEQNQNMREFYQKGYDKKLSDEVKSGNPRHIPALVKAMVSDMRRWHFRYEQVNFYNQNLVQRLFEFLDREQPQGAEVAIVSETVSFEEMERSLCEFLLACVEQLSRAKGGAGKQLVEKAVQYVEANYMDCALSLKQICEHLSVSASYFSALFKGQMGTTFIEYLTKIRMEKAKDLLKTTALRSYEIAERVGYADPHYFSVTFKKQIGCSPKEYRGRYEK